MKKIKKANVIMVLMIAGILLAGILIATMLTAEEESMFGSEYKITAIPENCLVTNENSANLCTITVLCNTILNNAEKLEAAKAPFDRVKKALISTLFSNVCIFKNSFI